MSGTVDIVIAGGGPAGLSLAAAMGGAGLNIHVVERQEIGALEAPAFDGRDIAITLGSIRRLMALGAWERIATADVSWLKSAHVINGRANRALSFESPLPGEPLGALVANAAIRKALFEVIREQPGCTIVSGASVASISPRDDRAMITLSDKRAYSAKLAVAADTRFSPLRQAMGIPAEMHDFGRTMLVCRVRHSKPHDGIATEWFKGDCAIAMLPLCEGVSSYVLTLPGRQIEQKVQLTASEFSVDAQRLTESRWGRLEPQSERYVYPLVAVYAQRFIAPRFALSGDAAVGMHPVTAHGYNFGLAGAFRLAQAIRGAQKDSRDIGGARVLSAYEREHRRATWPLFTATNAIAKLYSDNRPLHSVARVSGLQLMKWVEPVRRAVEGQLAA